MLSSVIQLLKKGNKAAANQVWRRLIISLKNTTTPININDLIYWVGHEAFLKNELKAQKRDLGQVQNNRQIQSSLNKPSQVSSQTMQTLSNVSKMLHDTAMAVIRKIG